MSISRAHTAEDLQRRMPSMLGKVLSFDLETSGLNPRKDDIIEFVIGWFDGAKNCAVVCPASLLGTQEFALIVDKAELIVIHNWKFEYQMMQRNHSAIMHIISSKVYDTMLVHHLVNENLSHSLDSIVGDLWDDDYKAEFWSKYDSYAEATEEDQTVYTGKDGIYTLMLYEWLEVERLQQMIPRSLVSHVHKLAFTLMKAELRGIRIDLDYLADLGREIDRALPSLEARAREASQDQIELVVMDLWEKELSKRKTPKGKNGVKRPEFKFSSPNHLKSLLYEKLELPLQTNPQTKKPSTDKTALEKLTGLHPVVDFLGEMNKLRSYKSKFIDSLLERQVNGRVYPEHRVNGAKSGRIASANPPIQQMPSKDPVWSKIRGIFVPEPGQLIVTADYNQVEVVIAAHYSQDENLLAIVRDGASQHDITAKGLGVCRADAKTINFAMQYGAGVSKIQKILKCSRNDATLALNKYWETYAGLKRLIDNVHAKIDRGEPIRSLFGRLRHFERRTRQPWDGDYRSGFSCYIQGTASDLTHMASIEADLQLETRKLGLYMFELHDEIIVQTEPAKVPAVQQMLEQVMVDAGVRAGLSVPLKVEYSPGLERWTK